MLNRVFYLRFAIIWTLLVLWLSVTSAGNIKALISFDLFSWDKAGHFAAYCIMTILWCKALSHISRIRIFVIIFTICFGVLMEIIQFYSFNGRTFEVDDIIANTLGAAAGILVINQLNK